jgi:hypothetical protein
MSSKISSNETEVFYYHTKICIYYFSTAFYALSLIAQTPYGAMSLKEFGWETYRVRSHSIPQSVSNTDSYQSGERLISKSGPSSSPRKSMSVQVTPPQVATRTHSSDNTIKHELNEPISPDIVPSFRFNIHQDSNTSDVKSKRSLTMPSTILLNANEKTDIRHGKKYIFLN